jgi:GAF domain-containing protein
MDAPRCAPSPGDETPAARLPTDALARIFVELAGTLTADAQPIEALRLLAARAVPATGADSASVLLADETGTLRLTAAADRRGEELAALELATDEGPTVAGYRSGSQIGAPALAAHANRWPQFVPAAAEAGIQATHTVPLRAGGEVLGALTLHRQDPGALAEQAAQVAQALADFTAIGVTGARSAHRDRTLAEQLQSALTSRITIEQAKGMLAERHGVSVTEAFDPLRQYARRTNRPLREVAHQVVQHSPEVADLWALGTRPPGSARSAHHPSQSDRHL